MSVVPSWGEQSLKQLQTCFRNIDEHRSRLRQQHQPEALHQLRVNLRRLRATVQLADEPLKLPKKLSSRQVARQGRCFGRVRDLDVLCEHLRGDLLPQLTTAEASRLRGCIERLERNRGRARKQAQAQLDSAELKQWLRSCRRWLKHPRITSLGERPLLDVLPDLQLRRLGELLLHPGWQAKDPDQDSESLHELRKVVKATRYQADSFRDYYGIEYGVWIDELRHLQTCLGGLQDLDVLRSLLKQELKKGMPELEQLLLSFEQQQWQQFQGLKSRYSSNESRQGLRQLVVGCATPR